MAKQTTLTYIVDFTVSVIQSEDGVAKNTGKTCAVSGVYDLDKDVVIRKELDNLKTIVTNAMAQQEKPKEEEKTNG